MKFAILFLLSCVCTLPCWSWGNQGHRLVGLVAADHLSPTARKNVAFLLDKETLADVASWADVVRPDETQTALWHYTDLPADSRTYDRERDCPAQPNVKQGSPGDKVRDCAVDRILYFQRRMADPTLDPADRAIALKYLVHFVGDQHQPMHATGVQKGANCIHVVVFGSPTCGERPCNLHAVWDSGLLTHRNLKENEYLNLLESEIKQNSLVAGTADPALWAGESKRLADEAILPEGGAVDDAYYNREIPVAHKQLEMAGLRLAAALNAAFTAKPARFKPIRTDTSLPAAH